MDPLQQNFRPIRSPKKKRVNDRKELQKRYKNISKSDVTSMVVYVIADKTLNLTAVA